MKAGLVKGRQIIGLERTTASDCPGDSLAFNAVRSGAPALASSGNVIRALFGSESRMNVKRTIATTTLEYSSTMTAGVCGG